MRAGTALLLGGLGLWAVSKLGTLNTLRLLEMELDHFDISLNGIAATMKTSNLTDNSIVLENLVGNVFLNEALAGQIGPFTPTTVPAKGSVLLPLNITINPAVILIEAISIFNGSKGVAATMKIVGTITADGIDIPFTTIRKLI